MFETRSSLATSSGFTPSSSRKIRSKSACERSRRNAASSSGTTSRSRARRRLRHMYMEPRSSSPSSLPVAGTTRELSSRQNRKLIALPSAKSCDLSCGPSSTFQKLGSSQAAGENARKSSRSLMCLERSRCGPSRAPQARSAIDLRQAPRPTAASFFRSRPARECWQYSWLLVLGSANEPNRLTGSIPPNQR